MGKSLTGQTALVSGATRGLGRAISLALASEGAHIIALGRTIGALEELDDEINKLGATATLAPIDLMDMERLNALGPALFPKFDKIDIFVASAAILGPLSPISHIPDDEWDKVITTNLTANMRLIRALDPLLSRADRAAAIFITDKLASEHQAYWAPYSIAKSGLEALANCYAAENQTTNITVKLFDPGPMATTLRRSAYPGEDQSKINNPVNAAKKLLEEILEAQAVKVAP